MKRMIFHHPYTIRDDGTSASQIRPYKMLQAFKMSGFEPFLIDGNATERDEKFKQLKSIANSGHNFDFLYCELSTTPWPFTDKIPRGIFVDPKIWQWALANRIPIGFYYRDIHWKIPGYLSSFSKLKGQLLLAGFNWELRQIQKFSQILFLPSEKMAQYIPIDKSGLKIMSLPPGCDQLSSKSLKPRMDSTLNLLYVGGVSPPIYDLAPTLDLLVRAPHYRLTIVTRAQEAASLLSKSSYDVTQSLNLNPPNPLAEIYRDADLFIMLWENNEYLSFAAPFKLYECAAYGLPIVALKGSLAASIIEKEQLGWTFSSVEEVIRFLEDANKNRSILNTKKENISRFVHENLWQTRATLVSQHLASR